MSSKNWFGPRDSVVSLTPPEGFEAVHQEGMTWYKDGINEFETTKKFAYEFNSEIAQLRGLLTVSGIDLSDLPENSPFLLREVILRAIMRILSMQEIDGYGLLDKATYDPQGKETDPFARANHTGTQGISTIAGLQAALDSKQADLNKQISIELGSAVGSSQPSYIDFHTLEGPSDLSARIIRDAGVNGVFGISNTGSGGILIAGGPGGVALTGGLVAVNGNAVWHAGNFAPGNYLPTAGGVLQSGAIIQYAADVGEKIRLYGGSYGIGIQSNELTLWGSASAALRFRQGGIGGTVIGELSPAGFKLPTATPTDNLHAVSKQYVEQYVNLGGAKAWVNFNGTGTVAIRSAHNVSSISDLGTGTYQVNFAAPMANANYCAVANSAFNATGNSIQYQPSVNDYTTTSVTVRTGQAGTTNNSPADNLIVNVVVFGG